jgi:hypothetical protein
MGGKPFISFISDFLPLLVFAMLAILLFYVVAFYALTDQALLFTACASYCHSTLYF